ncbi:glycosyl hydrolase [Alicyclobacillus fodiniaquatilis]|uniref:Glycosyl hydrolase n=1 Tax=Alicyclobacillus fodiniaquatilis TaxID=1661150 RepID=A0ABW4JEB7_9BACL
MDHLLFRNPLAKYRIHPFWFWNGEMDNAQIRIQIVEMAQKGLGGFFLCARQGMQIPYLSDAWFDKVEYAIQVAEQCHLDVWLYDEYPYPSGIAGGEVILQHPDAKHRTLDRRTKRASDGEDVLLDLPWGKIILALAVPVDATTGQKQWREAIDIRDHIGSHQHEPVFQKTGLTNYNQKRFFTYGTMKQLQWTAPTGCWEVCVFIEEEIHEFKYYGTFVDPGHQEAMKSFIEITHERYKQKVGRHFGKTVKGMFTDEIGFLGRYPWSSRLPDFFYQKNGYRLEAHLPALHDANHPQAAKIRYDYFQALHLLLRTVYHRQVHDWCAENGLDYAAEVPAMRMTTQLFSHVIGSDSAHDKIGRSLDWSLEHYYLNFRWNPKMTSSLARQLGRERALVECFHSVGWSMTLQDAKWMIDRMAAMGINFFNFHAFFYTLDGLMKHDAPPSQFLQNPYWRHFKQLGDYVGRISYVMSQGASIGELALLDPTTSFWTHLGNPLHGFRYIGDHAAENERLERLKSDWMAIGKTLLLNQMEYDHLDPELLMDADIVDGRICIGQATYSTLILPPMRNLEFGAWGKIKDFVTQGGTVISAGLLPHESIEEDHDTLQAELLALFGVSPSVAFDAWHDRENVDSPVPWTKGQGNTYFVHAAEKDADGDLAHRMMDLLRQLEQPVVQLADAKARRSFLIQCRSFGDSYVLFVANQEDLAWDLPIEVHLNRLFGEHIQTEQLRMRAWNLETGETQMIAFAQQAELAIVSMHFARYESHLIEIYLALPSDLKSANQPESVAPYQLALCAKDSWEVAAHQLNIIRFDTFTLTLNDEHAGTKVQVKTFIDQCADMQDEQKLPLQFQQVFGTPMKVQLKYPLRCTYQTQFTVAEVPSVCDIFMDSGAISGNYALYVNGHQIAKEDFHPKFVYDHMNVACHVKDFLRSGENKLLVVVDVQQDWDGLVDAIYLQGDFGVAFAGDHTSIITKACGIAALNGGPYPSYPYYAGTLSFKRSFSLEHLPANPCFTLDFSDWDPHFHDCAEVIINGQSLGVRPWSPYRWRGDTNLLRSGDNLIEVQVTNTLVGMLEGKYFDYANHQLIDVTDVAKEM